MSGAPSSLRLPRTRWPARLALLALLAGLGASPAEAQDTYPPRFNFSDTTVSAGDSLLFHPMTYAECLYAYDSRYQVVPDPASGPAGRFLIRITAVRRPSCALIMGYSGPRVMLKALPAGRYRLRFTDSSDFQVEVPDSVAVRVTGGNRIGRQGPSAPRLRAGGWQGTVDGRRFRRSGAGK